MSSHVAADGVIGPKRVHAESPVDEKTLGTGKHLDLHPTSKENLVYDHNDEEPELHARTYVALTAMLFLGLVLSVALQGPPTVVRVDRGADRTAGSN